MSLPSIPALPVPDIPGFSGSSSATSSGTATGGVINFSGKDGYSVGPVLLGVAVVAAVLLWRFK